MLESRVVTYNVESMQEWLGRVIRPHLRPDVSNYAKGRLRCWLGVEPSLTPNRQASQGLVLSPQVKERFQALIGWQYDYALITYSGDEQAVGITPHRDAGYADYEAYGLNLVGECRFSYWNDRKSFGRGPSTGVKHSDPPTHQINLIPGTLVRFNCKNLHQAEPQPRRWGINFWRAKP